MMLQEKDLRIKKLTHSLVEEIKQLESVVDMDDSGTACYAHTPEGRITVVLPWELHEILVNLQVFAEQISTLDK